MFGERLKSLRKSLNLTQKELEENLNVSGRVVGYYESNDRFTDKDTLIKITDFFEVSVDYLLGRTNSKNNTNIDSLKIDENDLVLLRNGIELAKTSKILRNKGGKFE
ncbi:helix-turn-helix domain-containing protein [Paraclostridium sordellii]|uniref:helix-turn-helix domain-containing protein n=1 Tax=Paraclostridium sordellii TaxID=1505 RepID=UPI001F052DD4|nr:helix-turn-helix transcriptional regulator [Paeniclostridium sordellii]MCH1965971.1 helix-turn-helix domain-containing protein [Paeniclostridium sordellii]